MADMAIYIRSGSADPQYHQDGDVVCAMPDDYIYCVHAEHICHLKLSTKNSDGLHGIDSLPDMMLSKSSEFKFQRISKTEVKRITLSDMSEEILGPVPNAKGEHINVPLFLQRRIKHAKHRIFGSKGNEYWYGGRKTFANISDIWVEIESRTGKLKSDHGKWPYTVQEQKSFLIIPVNAMTIDEAAERASSEIDNADPENPIILKKRKYKVDWKNIRGVSAGTISKIQNPSKPMDFRKFADYDWAIDSIAKA